MSSFELNLPPERPQYNPTNGQFLKGHVPHNKGKKWSDYMDGRKARRLRKFIREKLPHNGNPSVSGWNARPIYATDDDGNIVGWFASASDAGRKLGIVSRNITSVLHGKRQHVAGYRWIYADEGSRNKI